MTHQKIDTASPSYILKVGEDNRRYAQDLLAENERLRLAVVSLRNERLQLVEQIQLTNHMLDEHAAMRHVVSALTQEKQALQDELSQLQQEQARHLEEQEELQRQLSEIGVQNQRFSEGYLEVERRNNDLMNLYVASYRLHGTVDRQEVLGTIQEIVANLVGCEEQAIFEADAEGRELRLVASVGIDAEAFDKVSVGEGPIGRTAQQGETFVASQADGAAAPSETDLTACIPLKLNGRVTGAIALFRLLPHKPSLQDVDHELFDLLATHAATALYCTKLHDERAAQPQAGA